MRQAQLDPIHFNVSQKAYEPPKEERMPFMF